MPIFVVQITETANFEIPVKADTREQAADLASKLYREASTVGQWEIADGATEVVAVTQQERDQNIAPCDDAEFGMMTEKFAIDVFERAAETMAMWLARFRVGDPCDDDEPTDNDRLMAGHLAGALAGNNLLVAEMPGSVLYIGQEKKLRDALSQLVGWVEECGSAHEGRDFCLTEARAALKGFSILRTDGQSLLDAKTTK